MTTRLRISAFLSLLALSSVAGVEVPQKPGRSLTVRLLDAEYTTRITPELYQEMKAWSIASVTPPPVTPQDAYKLAKARMDRFEALKQKNWELDRVSLEPVGEKFIWVVSFQMVYIGSGSVPRMDFWVTMDGKLIEPTVVELKHEGRSTEDEAGA